MTLSDAEKSILKALAHFDVLDYPLTLLEIRKYSDYPLPLSQIQTELAGNNLNRIIGSSQGLYFLAGRENIVASRLIRYRLALLKLKKARFYARLLSNFPWVRAVAIYSSLALKNSRRDGDIDLFLITSKNRAWSARLFINIFLKLFHLRPTPNSSRDKICASYLVDEKNLDLSPANYENDYYYYYGASGFAFLSGSTESVASFWQANGWIKQALPNWQPQIDINSHQLIVSGNKCQSLLEIIFQVLAESVVKNWQLKIMPQKYHDGNDGKKVRLADGMIKLHDNDKRQKFNELFENNFNRLIDYERQD